MLKRLDSEHDILWHPSGKGEDTCQRCHMISQRRHMIFQRRHISQRCHMISQDVTLYPKGWKRPVRNVVLTAMPINKTRGGDCCQKLESVLLQPPVFNTRQLFLKSFLSYVYEDALPIKDSYPFKTKFYCRGSFHGGLKRKLHRSSEMKLSCLFAEQEKLTRCI